MTFTEGDLQIEFTGVMGGRKFDGPDHRLSHCMKAVDFVVELPDHYVYVELKDPQNPRATPQGRAAFTGKLRSGELENELRYKYRDSFLYEWASGRADKPVDYLVLIALDTLDDAQLLTTTRSLMRSLPQRGPDARPWQREIVRGCGVFNLESWNRRLPHYPATRVGAATPNAGTTA